MNENEDEKEVQYHNEGIVSRLTLWGNIVAFIILAVAVIDLFWNAYVWYNQVWVYSAPILIVIGSAASIMLMPFLAGVFYFLALRGLVQLLNLGLDLFDSFEMVEEETVEM